MLIRYTPGATGFFAGLRRAVRAVLYLPTAWRMAQNPCYPWLNAGAVRFLESHLTKRMTGFEWGGGRSTAFVARRVLTLVSVEHQPKWRRRTAALLASQALANVSCRFVPAGDAPGRPEARPDIWQRLSHVHGQPQYAAYTDAILEYPQDCFDFVLIDGRARVECAYNALSRVRPGGFLLLDNSEWEKYAPIFTAAAAAGWTRRDYENGVWRTSIFCRPETPAASAGPVTPIDPAAPAGSVAPVGPTGPAASAGPAAPAGPVVPSPLSPQ
ncbi:class I SAM-dependent methyltransferase [Solidesulfovibrio aerotolerans]|uniref:class I SAM-dependent methyltransferase n=1 Tax=Solidesulfovibrio aerotolerans TaxID=295255 RepID=UPI001FE278FC|nr:class I SAM-dependent methyltransferase [Solidesulfovibrio aerotolerans]